MAFGYADSPIYFEGDGINEVAKLKCSDKVVLKINASYYRPAEVDLLIGDSSKARNKLGWVPKVDLPELCRMMVEADLRKIAANCPF